MKLRVMSYNIRWGLGTDGRYHLERIADVIREAGADLVGMQEVECGSPRSRFLDQPRRLARMLDMEVAFGPNLRLGSWRFGNAILSRAPILSWRNVPLPVPSDHSPFFSARGRVETAWQNPSASEASPPRPGLRLLSATALLRRWTPRLFDRRGVLVSEIAVGNGGELTLTTLVTHLPLHRAVRLEQAAAILSLLPAHDAPALLLGDFNEGPRGRAVRRFLEGGLTELSGDAPTYPSAKPADKIDYILGRGAVRAVGAARVIASSASDHLPVVVDIEVLASG